jgi:large subunit ribosomal protein L3
VSFIIGKKVGMDQLWNENGVVTPVTAVHAGPVVVVQVRTKENDGYEAFQVGYDNTKKKLSKPLKGHFGDKGQFKIVKEFRKKKEDEYQVGDTISVTVFKEGDKVKVTGTDKGRGFQGVVKRHGFSGAPKTHGTKDQLRMPGSIGVGGVQRVVPGRKMGGRMGAETKTVKNLRVIKVDEEKNMLWVKGAIPGNKKGIITIESL